MTSVELLTAVVITNHRFTELGRDDMDNVDIDIKFVTGHHPPPASDSFDGQGGVLAHAWYPPIGKISYKYNSHIHKLPQPLCKFSSSQPDHQCANPLSHAQDTPTLTMMRIGVMIASFTQ